MPPEPPKPVDVPLVTLSFWLVSELHPIKPKREIIINKKREIKENDLLGMGLFPTGDIFIFPFPPWFVITAQGIEVILPVAPGALIIVGIPPGIQGEIFFQIGAVPFIPPRVGH